MKLRYDSNADALYITLSEGNVDCTKEMDKNTLVDFDKNGVVIGIELLFVKERNFLKEFKTENIIEG
ncbi:DUF2283 domain-containing protein [Candidatus Woesearchaeota archaeon]|nr:MAG: DUF2283 domain-containing protein [Candidatus Woesearchaeota archaeon]